MSHLSALPVAVSTFRKFFGCLIFGLGSSATWALINKQGKSVMLGFFANCSDLCQLTAATSRRTMYIS